MTATPCSTVPVAGYRRGLSRIPADLTLVLADVVLVCAGVVAALGLRFDGAVPLEYWRHLPIYLVIAAIVYVGVNARFGLYRSLWQQAGPGEAWNLVLAAIAATLCLIAVTAATSPDRLLPLTVPANAGALTMMTMGAVRFGRRVLAWRAEDQSRSPDARRVVIVGRVQEIRALLGHLNADATTSLVPVAVVTDERNTWGRTLLHVPVVGPIEELADFVQRWKAQQVLMVRAAGEGDAAGVTHVAELARTAGVPLRLMTTLYEGPGRARTRDLRDVLVEDLLGREAVEIDDDGIRATISGRRVLVTGAGGSIGSEIVAQVSAFAPGELVMLDHDETHLHDAAARLSGDARTVLGDIRDEDFVRELFAEARPDLIFHAAAHKHVPILEQFTSEAVRTNIHGTDVLVRAAVDYGCERFVGISTDKAVNPTSVMGATKRLSEQLLLHRAGPGLRYCVVRFGNVLGSRGSVVPTFLRQARDGGPLTVTHKDMTRFFMTTQEAVQLVLQSAAITNGGELFMLDMGEPVRIVDLAERVIALTASRSDDDVRIEFTGLRPGEKLTEELASQDEVVEETSHPKILVVRSPLTPRDALFAGIRDLLVLAEERDEIEARALLFDLARPSWRNGRVLDRRNHLSRGGAVEVPSIGNRG